ncbi:hypothetical protein GA0115259_103542 [Streptomyces sp. MnatMP-M17]|nr:hypothetical protein GA0115259_103542 [Streptomyces sp. MnatMP-M17]
MSLVCQRFSHASHAVPSAGEGTGPSSPENADAHADTGVGKRSMLLDLNR